MKRKKGRKVQVREIDGTTYIGYLIQLPDIIVNNEIPKAVIEDEKGYVDAVEIDRIKFVD